MTAAGIVLVVLKTVGTNMGVKQEKGLVEARTASPSKKAWTNRSLGSKTS
jgi:hypothetical protein